MLTGLNQKMEKTTTKLQRIDDRLKVMIASKSKSFYYVIIAIEIVAIALLIIL